MRSITMNDRSHSPLITSNNKTNSKHYGTNHQQQFDDFEVLSDISDVALPNQSSSPNHHHNNNNNNNKRDSLIFGTNGGETLQFGNNDNFYPVKTSLWIMFIFSIIIINMIQVWIELFHSLRDRYVLAQCLMMIAFTFAYIMIRYEHGQLQLHGYLQFYYDANAFARFVFFTTAYGVCLVVITYVYLPSGKIWGITSRIWLNIIVTLESTLQMVALSKYAYACWEHNKLQAPPDADILYDLPAALSNPQLSSSPKRPTDTKTLIYRQSGVIRFLESKVKTLSEELLKARQNDSVSIAYTNRESERALLAKEQEVRALKVELDRVHAKLAKAEEDLLEFQKMSEIIRNENAESMNQVDQQKEIIAKQAQEISRLLLLLDVQKEANLVSRKTIEEYEYNNSKSP